MSSGTGWLMIPLKNAYDLIADRDSFNLGLHIMITIEVACNFRRLYGCRGPLVQIREYGRSSGLLGSRDKPLSSHHQHLPHSGIGGKRLFMWPRRRKRDERDIFVPCYEQGAGGTPRFALHQENGMTRARMPPGRHLRWARSRKFEARPALPWPAAG